MANHNVTFQPSNQTVQVPTGSLIVEAIERAGLDVSQPCGGQGRCGRCAIIVEQGEARRRSTIRLSTEDVEAGYALACQTVIEGDLVITIPESEQIQRRLVTDKSAGKIVLPFEYVPDEMQSVRVYQLDLPAPTIDDNLDDLTRIQKAFSAHGYPEVDVPLPLLRKLSSVLRESDWKPWVAIEQARLNGPARLIEASAEPIPPIGLALDIGTTTVTAYMVDLETGQVKAHAAEYNGQIARGEDVISRIIVAGKNGGLMELGALVRQTVDGLLDTLQKRTGIAPSQILKVTVVGNTTMMHLFLEIPPEYIRLTPFIPATNQPPLIQAKDLPFDVHPLASVDCLPGVASYVGADITAGVLSSGLSETEGLTLFIDVGTNGEIVLGTQDWMVTCACSAGPAFEGAGVVDGMRATEGAIEEVWVNSQTFEPTIRVIGGVKPKGICGSGLISLLAELFVTGVIDRSGNVKLDLESKRVRSGEHGPEYVVAWADETEHGKDIVLSKVDVDNLMRAKAAIYAGFSVLADSVGVDLNDVEHVLVGGSFGQYINVENAVKIGLLPDVPWDRFKFLGNTAVLGSYMALLSREARERINTIAGSMTYLELSADNSFYDAFTAALFLPHTDITRFPSVAKIWEREDGVPENAG